MIVVFLFGLSVFFMLAPWTAWHVWSVRRTARHESVLRMLEITARKQFPLGPGIGALADTYRGSLGAEASALSAMVSHGASLPDALERVPTLTSSQTRLIVRMGWDSGALAPALEQAAAGQAMRRRLWNPIVDTIGYLTFLVLYSQAILFFLMYWILPKFEKIFADFDSTLPWMTKLLIQASNFMLDTGLMALLNLFLTGVVLGFIACVILLLSGYEPVVRIASRTTPFSDVTKGTLLRALATPVDRDRPMTDALRMMRNSTDGRRLRRRLSEALESIEQGMPWWTALRSAGLIRAVDATLLESAQRAGNLSWAMSALADAGDRRVGYRLHAWTQVLGSAALISFGVVIGFVVIGFFQPLVKLISELAL